MAEPISRPKKIRAVIQVIGPSIAYLPLTQGQYSLIDSVDADLIGKRNWFAQFKPDANRYYAARHVWRGKGSLNEKISLHSFLAPCLEGYEIDHANRNSLDNRRCNLRLSSRAENNHNRVQKNRLDMPGVRLQPSGRFQARIGTPPNRKNLGTFDTAEEAYAAYLAASKIMKGKFHPS